MPDLPVIDDPWIGKTLDERFHVLGLLGKGGMGTVYRCRELTTGAELAVKLVLKEIKADKEVQARFEREIQASIDIVHPNVVRVLGHGQTADGQRYYAMELIQGRGFD